MKKQLYWLSDTEWKRIEPLMPRGRRGAHRVDDRRVISGIMPCCAVALAGETVRRTMAPTQRSTTASIAGAGKASGPIFSMRSPAQPAGSARCRSTRRTSKPTARQQAQKGGLRASDRPLARRAHHKNPRADRGSRPPSRFPDHIRKLPRLACRTRSAADRSAASTAPSRQSLRCQEPKGLVGRTARKGRDPAQSNPQTSSPIRR